MPTVETTRNQYAQLGSFVTYAAPRHFDTAITVQDSRARSWVRQFKGKKAAFEYLAINGYIPSTPYTDDRFIDPCSKVLEIWGQMYSDPASKYQWAIIPGTPRYGVNVQTDPKVLALRASLLEKLQSRISGHGTNLLVSASEARQTVGMIGDAVAKLSTAYRHVRHANFRAAALALGLQKTPKRVSKRESVGDNWLQYRYGWRLVVYDVVSLMKTLHDSLTTRPPILRVTGFEANERSYTWDLGEQQLTLPNGLACLAYTKTQRTKFVVVVRGGYIYQLESVPLATGQAFGLSNPFTWAWEVIPYSFVVDWFTNVGSVVEGLTAFQGKKCLDGWITKSIESETTFQWSNLRKLSGVNSMFTSGERLFGPSRERRFAREPIGFTPVSIRLDVSLNQERVTDAVMLIKQMLRK